MAHGSALKEAWAARGKAPPKKGGYVSYFNMTLPCNGTPGPGPHRARVKTIHEDGSLDLTVWWGSAKTGPGEARLVHHRGMADGPRFWDYRKE